MFLYDSDCIKTLQLNEAFDEARSLEMAQMNSDSFSVPSSTINTASINPSSSHTDIVVNAISPKFESKCFFVTTNDILVTNAQLQEQYVETV